jgi:hypothetical protein
MKILRKVNNKKRFVVRTIRDGTVQIFNHRFKPTEPYDGQLDGQRMAFGIYYQEDMMMDTLFLWGTEAMYTAKTTEEYLDEYLVQPNVDIRGVIHWVWWKAH